MRQRGRYDFVRLNILLSQDSQALVLMKSQFSTASWSSICIVITGKRQTASSHLISADENYTKGRRELKVTRLSPAKNGRVDRPFWSQYNPT